MAMRNLILMLTLTLWLLGENFTWAQITTNVTVHPGIELTQIRTTPTESPLVITALTIDLLQPGRTISGVLGEGTVLSDSFDHGRERIGDLARRAGALVAINADYFSTDGDPLGLMIHHNELVSDSMPNRVAIGFTDQHQIKIGKLKTTGLITAADGSQLRLAGINKIISSGTLLYTNEFGPLTLLPDPAYYTVISPHAPLKPNTDVSATVLQTGFTEVLHNLPPNVWVVASRVKDMSWLTLHTKPGDKLSLRFELVADTVVSGNQILRLTDTANVNVTDNWSDVTEAISGGPWLLRNGCKAVDGIEEGFNPGSFINQKHPRSAVGVTAEGKLLLVAVDGRHPYSMGASLSDLADILLKLGAYQAINLDGGGSTQLVVKGLYVNAPSEYPVRPVANALAIFDKGYRLPTYNYQPDDKLTYLRPGETLPVQNLTPSTSTPEINLWGCLEGSGFVDQRGMISSDKTTGGTIIRLVNDRPWMTRFLAMYERPKAYLMDPLALQQLDPILNLP